MRKVMNMLHESDLSLCYSLTFEQKNQINKIFGSRVGADNTKTDGKVTIAGIELIALRAT